MRELSQSLTQLLRSPVFTAASVVTLTLAVAAATTVYSVYNALVLRPARVMNWDGVYQVMQPTVVWREIERPQIRALREYQPVAVEALVSLTWRPVVLEHQQRAIRSYAEATDGDIAGVFKLRARTGRLLDRRDDAPGMRSAVVSAAVWERWFGGRREMHGHESLKINGATFTIVGVMPPGIGTFGADVWIPATTLAAIEKEEARLRWWRTFVRPRPDVSVAQLTSAIAAVLSQVPTETGARGARLHRGRGFGVMRSEATQVFGLAGLLMLAACVNLTNLAYARIAQRRSEIAVRLALGAGFVRVIRMFVLEIIAMAATAAFGGYLLALAALRLLTAVFPTFRRDEWGLFLDLRPDWHVAVFAVGTSASVALVLCVVVATNLSRLSGVRAFASAASATTTGTGGRRFRSTLVAIQVTIAVALVMGSGLWLVAARKQLDRALDFSEFRFTTSRLATLRLDFAYQGYSDTRGRDLQVRALEAVRRVPGVDTAALSTGIPGASAAQSARPSPMFLIADEEGRVLSGPPPSVQGSYAAASSGFLNTIGLPLVRGRDFGPPDVDGAALVALISESVAVMLFPKGDALGRRLLFNTDKRPRTIIGIFRDPLISARERWMVQQNILVLVPMTQHYRREIMIVVRSNHPAAALEASASSVASLDPALAVFDAAPVEEALLAETAPYRASAKGVSALGALSLLFAALGVYGVMSFFVSTRIREFGIRMALGASPAAVLRHVFYEARLLLLFGLLCGTFLMAVVERVLDHRIARLMPNAVETWIASIVLVLVTGLVATAFPARRAARTDPLVALREL